MAIFQYLQYTCDFFFKMVEVDYVSYTPEVKAFLPWFWKLKRWWARSWLRQCAFVFIIIMSVDNLD